jgi:hypothetical protein
VKISILMAAHHSGPYIAQALASIRAQTHPDWELLVVEYGSADQTRELSQEFGLTTGRSVTHLNLGSKHGVASARNRLLDLATGDWVAFLDPCDRWTPHHLTNAALRLIAKVDLVASDVRIEGSSPAIDLSPSRQLAVNATRTLFVADALPYASAVALRRALATQVGFFDTQFEGGETRDFWLRCAQQGAVFAATHRPTCRVDRPVDTDPARALVLADQRIQFYEKYRDLAGVPAALRRHLLSASLVTKGRLLRVSDPAGAAQYFLRAWALQPMYVQRLGQLALTGLRLPGGAPVEPNPLRATPTDV